MQNHLDNQYVSDQFMDDVLMSDGPQAEREGKVFASDAQIVNETNFNKLFALESQTNGQSFLDTLPPTTATATTITTDDPFLQGFLGLQSDTELMNFNASLHNLNDSMTINSQSVRSSSEFFDQFEESPNSSNSYNSHNDLDTQLQLNLQAEQDQQLKQKGRFGFSNQLSNMFRSQSQRLRGINPLFSTTKEQQAQQIPQQFIDPMQVNPSYLPPANDSVDPLETTTTTTATTIEEHGILRRGTRSATNSIVNALNSARFSFNKTKPDRRLDGIKDIDESVQEQENDLMEQDDIESMMDKMLNMDHFINNNDGGDGEESYRNNSVIGHEGLTRDSLDMVLPSNIRISVENIDGVADYNQSFDINQNANIDFNQELNRVISMASLTPSNYDFNRMNNVAVNEPQPQQPLQQQQSLQQQPQPAGIPVKSHVQSSASSVKTAQSSSHSTNSTSNVNLDGSQPNYAALFSNMNPKKRPSRSFSIGKLANLSQSSKKEQDTPQQQQQQLKQEPPSPSKTYLTNNFLKIEEDDTESNLLHTPRSSMQSHITTDDLASFDSTTTSLSTSTTEPKVRGRKPSTEYDASRTFVCKACQRRFKREEHLKRHFRSLHMHEKPFNCPKCNKKFSRTDNLTQHLKTHAD